MEVAVEGKMAGLEFLMISVFTVLAIGGAIVLIYYTVYRIVQNLQDVQVSISGICMVSIPERLRISRFYI